MNKTEGYDFLQMNKTEGNDFFKKMFDDEMNKINKLDFLICTAKESLYENIVKKRDLHDFETVRELEKVLAYILKSKEVTWKVAKTHNDNLSTVIGVTLDILKEYIEEDDNNLKKKMLSVMKKREKIFKS